MVVPACDHRFHPHHTRFSSCHHVPRPSPVPPPEPHWPSPHDIALADCPQTMPPPWHCSCSAKVTIRRSTQWPHPPPPSFLSKTTAPCATVLANFSTTMVTGPFKPTPPARAGRSPSPATPTSACSI